MAHNKVGMQNAYCVHRRKCTNYETCAIYTLAPTRYSLSFSYTVKHFNLTPK